jgi:hypothetical protein
VLRDALVTDDGRRILAEALTERIPPYPPIDVSIATSVEEYPELGRPSDTMDDELPAPVFVTGRFRSGSTLLWNIFRSIEGCHPYYEPLNERRWFDPTRRGTRVDGTHLGVSEYWREYDGLEHLGNVFHDDWHKRNLYMDEGAWDPDLVAYIKGLVDAARPRRAVLQFNRVDFRLPWLKRWFPRAPLIHVFRHPRDQWCSSLVDITAFPKDGRLADFEAHDHFYLLAWVHDLRHRFPILDERAVEHPYELFYLLWKLSWLYGRRYSDHSVSLEGLIGEPEEEIRKLLEAVGMQETAVQPLVALITGQPQGRWRTYADDQWFAEREIRCEALLRTWAGGARKG